MSPPAAPAISFIVPAFNEEALLGGTLEALQRAARALGDSHEVLVVDDASTDRTAEVAAAGGARVVAARCRQIAGARNAGARESRGEVLVFVDADTLVSEEVLRAMRRELERGAVGGGARVDVEGIPRRAVFWLKVFEVVYQSGLGYAAGCFLFARREAFERVGGFDERYYASEELHLSRRLKREGRFVILRERVRTSGRKLRMYTGRQILLQMLRMLALGPRGLRRREGLELWYSGRREPAAPADSTEAGPPGSPAVRSPPPGGESPSGTRSPARSG